MSDLRPIGDVADFINGCAFKPSDWGDEGKPIIRIQNLTDTKKTFNRTTRKVSRKYEVTKGDLLVSWSATLGVFRWEREDALLNQHIFKVVPDTTQVYLPYLKFALENCLHLMGRFTHGSTMKHINRQEFLETKAWLPPLEEQRRIAAILDKADAIRRKRQRALTLADDFLRSTFLEMFGDPVVNLKGLQTVDLEELIDASRGISYGIVQRGEEVANGVPVIRISNFVTNEFDGSIVVRTSPDISSKYQRTIIRGGELLLSIRGTVGKVAVAPVEARGWNVSREVAVIPVREEYSSDFIRASMLSPHSQRFLLGNVKGVAQRGINLKDVRQLPVFVPEERHLDGFLRLQRKAIKIYQSEKKMFHEASNMFTALSQRAFRGEL